MFKKSIIIITIIVAISSAVWFFFVYKKPILVVPVEEPKAIGPVVKVIGLSVEGRKIESFTYSDGQKNSKNHVVLVGGIHGGYEWNSVLLAYEFMDYLDKNPASIPANIKVTVIPNMNPDGVYKVVGKEGWFTASDVSTDKTVLASGRFNGNNVDLNRNFDCKWKPESKWQSKTVSAGSEPFSEPESLAIKDFAIQNKPDAFVFYHSQANSAYGSDCGNGTLPEVTSILSTYSNASGYPAAKSFTSYEITGDVTDWLSTVGIPAISIELKTHEDTEFEKNLAGLKALIGYYAEKE